MTILEALEDDQLFAPFFQEGASWVRWRALLAALFGLGMTYDELAAYREYTARRDPPQEPAREGWLVVGRRGGKSRIAALVAVYLACFRNYESVLLGVTRRSSVTG